MVANNLNLDCELRLSGLREFPVSPWGGMLLLKSTSGCSCDVFKKASQRSQKLEPVVTGRFHSLDLSKCWQSHRLFPIQLRATTSIDQNWGLPLIATNNLNLECELSLTGFREFSVSLRGANPAVSTSFDRQLVPLRFLSWHGCFAQNI